MSLPSSRALRSFSCWTFHLQAVERGTAPAGAEELADGAVVAVEGALVAPALVAPALVDGVTLVDGVAEAEEEEDDALARATMRAYQTRGVRGQAELEWPVWLLGPLQQSPWGRQGLCCCQGCGGPRYRHGDGVPHHRLRSLIVPDKKINAH